MLDDSASSLSDQVEKDLLQADRLQANSGGNRNRLRDGVADDANEQLLGRCRYTLETLRGAIASRAFTTVTARTSIAQHPD